MHRYDVDNVAFVKSMKSQGHYTSISLGAKASDYAVVNSLSGKQKNAASLFAIVVNRSIFNWAREICKKLKKVKYEGVDWPGAIVARL